MMMTFTRTCGCTVAAGSECPHFALGDYAAPNRRNASALSTRTTCARCAWPLEIEGLSDEDADRVEAMHRQRCPEPADDSITITNATATSVSFNATPINVHARVVWRPRPDGFAQSAVDAAKAVLLSKVERKR